MLKVNTVTMKNKIEEILKNSYTNFGEFDESKATKELLNLFSVNTRSLEEKGLEYAYELAKQTHTDEDGIFINIDVLKMVAKDYVKHVSHFLNVC